MPRVTSLANTTAEVASSAALPRKRFAAAAVGVSTTNSPASPSKVAVVASEATSEPWPHSVIAKQPSVSRRWALR